MKNLFFLPIAVLAVIFSFSACSSDDKDDNSSSDSSIACEMGSLLGLVEGGMCIELYDITNSQLTAMKNHCTKGDLGYGLAGAGTLKNKCPDDAVYDCVLPQSMYGFEGKSFYYGEYGEQSKGMCPGDNDGNGDDDNDPIACANPSNGEGSPLLYEGQTYKTVKIGCQTWMAENLNYNATGSKCYDDEPENCEIYGRLYTWKTALSVCPSGWHLPSYGEWKTLIKAVGGDSVAGKHLKATDGWEDDSLTGNNGNGLDTYGFTALPGSGVFTAGSAGHWWSSSEDELNDGYATGVAMSNRSSFGFGDSVSQLMADQDGSTSSVRCVKDSE